MSHESSKTEVHAIPIQPNSKWPVVTNPNPERLDDLGSNRQRQRGHKDSQRHRTQNSIPNLYTGRTMFEIT